MFFSCFVTVSNAIIFRHWKKRSRYRRGAVDREQRPARRWLSTRYSLRRRTTMSKAYSRYSVVKPDYQSRWSMAHLTAFWWQLGNGYRCYWKVFGLQLRCQNWKHWFKLASLIKLWPMIESFRGTKLYNLVIEQQCFAMEQIHYNVRYCCCYFLHCVGLDVFWLVHFDKFHGRLLCQGDANYIKRKTIYYISQSASKVRHFEN